MAEDRTELETAADCCADGGMREAEHRLRMTTIYVVCNYLAYQTVGVFTDRHKAEQWCQRAMVELGYDSLRIEEHAIDPAPETAFATRNRLSREVEATYVYHPG